MARKNLSDTTPIAVGAFRANRSASVSLGVASPAFVPYDIEAWGTSGWYGVNATYSRSGFTPQVAGIYHISFGMVFNPVTGYFSPEIRVNGAAKSYSGTSPTNAIAGATWHFGHDYIKVAVNDFVEIATSFSVGGATVTLLNNPAYTFFAGHLVGAA